MGGWWQDLRYAGRMIAKHPGASGLAVVALALGIGLTTTMFSIVQGAVLRGLPYEGAEKIHYLSVTSPSNPEGESPSFHDFTDWRSRQQSFESLEGYNQLGLQSRAPADIPNGFEVCGSRRVSSSRSVSRLRLAATSRTLMPWPVRRL